MYRGEFSFDELFDGIEKSTMEDPRLENVCKVLLMYALFGEPIDQSLDFGVRGSWITPFVGVQNKYAIDKFATECSLMSQKPNHENYILVSAIFGSGYWYLTGNTEKLNLKRVIVPQDSRFVFWYKGQVEYDLASLDFLMEKCIEREATKI